ncbi:MAG: PAS domain S-box protein [Betaproteobacteria bacterium]|nr:PAS domain S-box protein [Betaproteobacteria bacterium]
MKTEAVREEIKAVLDSIPTQLVVIDSTGFIIQVNEAWSVFARENGGAEALACGVGTNYLEVCQSSRGDWSDEALVAYEGVYTVLNGVCAKFELEYPCHSPTEKRWFLMTVSPFKGTHGGAVVSHVDITQRKLAEIRRASFDRIIERSLNEIYIYDADTLCFIEVNESACRNLGYTLSELQSMTPIDICPEYTEETFAALVCPLLNDEKDKIVFTAVHQRKDGSNYPVEVHLQCIMFDDSQVYAAIILDITQRTQTEEALAQARLFLESTPDATIIVNDSGKIKVANSQATNLFGYSQKELRGMPVEVLVPERFRDEHPMHRRQFAVNLEFRSKNTDRDLCAFKKNGQKFPIEVSFSSIQTGDGTLVAVAIRDVTTRKQAEEALRQSEERFRGLVEGSVQGIVIERDGRVLFVNQSFADIFGYDDPSEIYAIESLCAIYHPDELGMMQYDKAYPDASKILPHYEFCGVRKDGSVVWIESQKHVVMWDDRPAVQSTVIDVTKRRRAEEALFNEKERAQVTLESIGDAVITTDARGRVNYCNAVAEALTAWRRDEALGQPLTSVFNIVNEETREPVDDPVARCLVEGAVVSLARNALLLNRQGYEFSIQDSAAPIRNRQGELLGAVLVFSDVSEQRRLIREISHHASHDELTGLVNRREFEHRLERVLEAAFADHNENALCYLDLDQFKIINDTCGHVAGDVLLGQIADLFNREIRERDTLARLGGDEFGVLLEHCGLEQAKRVANALRSAVDEFRFVWNDKPFRIGVSIGVVPVTDDSQSIAAVLQAADRACYLAKDAGRNRIHVYHEHDAELARRHGEMQWVSRIQQALENDGFQLYAQIIEHMEMNSSGGLHCEILLRLVDSTNRVIHPDVFIPAAERYNLAVRIDRWVIDHVFRWLAEQPTVVDSLKLCAINLSGQSLSDRFFEAYVLRQLEATGIPGEKICFEITETAAIANINDATRFIKTLKSHGCRFALDDFGSGLSSFAYLKNLPVDILKIDGIFVKDMIDDTIDHAMVRSINEIGQLMGKETIAECVENEDIRNKLYELGVNFVQGFGVSRPQPIAHLLKETWRYSQTEAKSRALVEGACQLEVDK